MELDKTSEEYIELQKGLLNIINSSAFYDFFKIAADLVEVEDTHSTKVKFHFNEVDADNTTKFSAVIEGKNGKIVINFEVYE